MVENALVRADERSFAEGSRNNSRGFAECSHRSHSRRFAEGARASTLDKSALSESDLGHFGISIAEISEQRVDALMIALNRGTRPV